MQQSQSNTDAEKALLGSILASPEYIDAVAEVVRADNFWVERHRWTWEAALAIHGRGETVDVVTVSEELGEHLEDVGGPAFLTGLVLAAPNPMASREYAKIVATSAARRSVLAMAAVMSRDAMAGDPWLAAADGAKALDGLAAPAAGISSSAGQIAGDLLEELKLYPPGTSVASVRLLWKDLDYALGGLMRGELVVAAARPNMGKTQFAVQQADYSVMAGRKVLIHAMEGGKNAIIRRTALARSGVNWLNFRRGTQTQAEIDALAAAYVEIMAKDAPMRVVDKTTRVEEFEVIAKATARELGGLDLVVVDYLQLYKTDKKDRVNELGDISAALKRVALENNCVVLATAQLNRGVEGREDKKPTMADIRGSGLIEQDADIIIGIYRETYYTPGVGSDGSGPTDFLILKSRDGERSLSVSLYWSAKEVRFKDATIATGGLVRRDVE